MNEEDYVDVNIDDIEDPGEAIPDGHYLCRINTVTKVPAKGDGKFPYLDIRMNPLEGPNLKKRLRLNLSFHPDALWNMKSFVPMAGVSWPKGKGFFYKDLLSKEVRVTVKVKPHPDDAERKVNEVGPPYSRV